MVVHSAGILLYQIDDHAAMRVWIAHMSGPFWARKDEHAWSIPKGEYDPDEEPLTAALREFEEEIGSAAPAVQYAALGNFRQPSGKIIAVFAAETDFQPDRVVSNTFSVEWPRGSGVVRDYPEIDDARWVAEPEARVKLVRGQLPILDALARVIRSTGQ
ncbi:NUDIX domain-containing protein [Salinibacterium sp. ZJ454]|uniref:NUDIX domain-containing protein n=1 Tax=Salinibacterium sp. ZJ454 TaxID=2708339 RepID=UPI001421DA2F|nr:NUDIX domain-containing protein [Salinibacterium sp. ZJ454]